MTWLGVLTYFVFPCGNASCVVGGLACPFSQQCSSWLLCLLACQSPSPSALKLEYLEIMQNVIAQTLKCKPVTPRGILVNPVLIE